MPDSDDDMEPFPGMSGTAVRFLNDLKRTGESIEISINGKFSFSIEDDQAFQELFGLVDRLELIRTVRAALKRFDDGEEGVSLEEAKEQFRLKYGRSL